MTDLTIIGGGIAGLAAAYYANKLSGGALHITLMEAADYWGGKIVTDRAQLGEGAFVIEGGPDTFVVTKPWAVALCRQLGLSERLRGANPETKRTYILKNDRLHELPGGLTMMIPTEFMPMLRTGLLSWPEKARMGLDFFLPPATDKDDETMGQFVSRRLGRAAYESLIEPLMSGIYAGDGDRLSLQATLPYLKDLEEQHGGLVKGALAARRERARKAKSNGNGAKPAPGSRSIFLTPLTGLAEISEALVEELQASGVELRLNAPVTNLQHDPDGNAPWRIELRDGERIESGAVILATPAYVSGALLEDITPDLAAELQAIEYVSTATVTLAYRQSDLPRPLDGYGYVIPRRESQAPRLPACPGQAGQSRGRRRGEGRKALACTWTSSKFPHRAPDDHALIRVFVGRAGQEEQITWEDDVLLAIAKEELETTLDITAEPVLTRIYQWEKAMPQYNLGHPERLQRIETALAAFPSLALAGNGYYGIGIPDCIHSGELAAQKVTQSILQTVRFG